MTIIFNNHESVILEEFKHKAAVINRLISNEVDDFIYVIKAIVITLSYFIFIIFINILLLIFNRIARNVQQESVADSEPKN